MLPLYFIMLLAHSAETHQENLEDAWSAVNNTQAEYPEIPYKHCIAIIQGRLVDNGFIGSDLPSCFWNKDIPDDDGGCRAFTLDELTPCYRIVDSICNAVFGFRGDDTLWRRNLAKLVRAEFRP